METMRKYIKPTMEEYDVDAAVMLCRSNEEDQMQGGTFDEGYDIPL